jgi:hypothetical protein
MPAKKYSDFDPIDLVLFSHKKKFKKIKKEKSDKRKVY